MRLKIAEKWNRDASEFIFHHPAVSAIIWLFAVISVLGSLSFAVPKEGPTRFGPLAWIAIGILAYAPVPAILLPRLLRQSQRDVLAVRWAVAQAGWLAGLAALFDRSPQWLISVGLVEAAILMLFSLRSARGSAASQY